MPKGSLHSHTVRTAVRSILAGAIAVASGNAIAQEAGQANTTELEEVVVTGYRESLEQSLNIKRANAGAVDAIFAEDIADFPDTNLAESVQRIPGVAIDRVGGEGRQISIRGLSPEFSRVRINGMEALTTTSATDAVGTNRTRAFDFNVFASELFNQISVRKTSSAEIDEGSLGATIDLFTARPLDFEGFKFVARISRATTSWRIKPTRAPSLSSAWRTRIKRSVPCSPWRTRSGRRAKKARSPAAGRRIPTSARIVGATCRQV